MVLDGTTLNQYTTFADGGNNSFVGRNGYTDAYTTLHDLGAPYNLHTKQRYDADQFTGTASGNPVYVDTAEVVLDDNGGQVVAFTEYAEQKNFWSQFLIWRWWSLINYTSGGVVIPLVINIGTLV